MVFGEAPAAVKTDDDGDIIVSFKIISVKSLISSYIRRPIKSQPWII